MPDYKRIPCVIMRGGTSRGPFLLADDLPSAIAARDDALLAIMGAGHELQVDGIGGASPQTSKVAIVSRSRVDGCDIDYLFAQVGIADRTVDTKPNCGNMLAGVGPFAIEAGLVRAEHGETTVHIHNVNTGAKIDAIVQTPAGVVTYDGTTVVPGVPGEAARIDLLFRDIIGAKTGRLFPTGRPIDDIDGLSVTLIDCAVPMLLVRAVDIDIDTAAPWSIETNLPLLQRLERLRRTAGHCMGLGDVSRSVIPKVGIIGEQRDDATCVAYLMPWQVHRSLAVTGGICMATALKTTGTIAALSNTTDPDVVRLRHPSGVMDVTVRRDADGGLVSAGVVRTARRIFEGHALVPARLYANPLTDNLR